MVSGKLAGRIEADLEPGVPRTWNVDISGLVGENGIQESIPISSRHFHRHAKILIIRIGDWDTEQLMLNPLASSLKAQLSLLLPPSYVDVEYIRTPDELRGAFSVHGGGLSGGHRRSNPWGYAVIVGHGRAENPALRFGNDWHGPTAVANRIAGLGPGQKSFGGARFISLCCETGEQGFAAAFSSQLNTTWVGPGATVHAFEAAAFVQRLFFEHFLRARTWLDAFRHARNASVDFSTSFRCWMGGEEKAPA